jgi:hypothetical protein
MRILRLLTIIATLLSLPVYGFAAADHARTYQQQLSGVKHVAMTGDCCPDAAGKSTPCQHPDKSNACNPCKAGQHCKSPQTYQPTQLSTVIVIPALQVAVDNIATHLSEYSPDRLLRPPSLI